MHHRKVDSQGRIINAVHEHVHGMPVVWAFLQIHSQASVNAQRSELVSEVVVLSVEPELCAAKRVAATGSTGTEHPGPYENVQSAGLPGSILNGF